MTNILRPHGIGARIEVEVGGGEILSFVSSGKDDFRDSLGGDDHWSNSASRLRPMAGKVETIDGRKHREAVGAELLRRHLPAEHPSLTVIRESKRGHGGRTALYHDVILNTGEQLPQTLHGSA